MRKELPAEVESRRVAGDHGSGPYGMFRLTHPETGRSLHVVASDGRDWDECGLAGPPWEHVSVSPAYGCPLWAEMCWVKDLFFGPDEWVVQYHPAAKDYVNIHPRVLHLWRPVGVDFPIPPNDTV